MDIFQNKWVDRYMLRYGPATIVGAVILAYFYAKRREFGVSISLTNEKYLFGLILVIGGFLYAYVASAPILVFHFARPLFADPVIAKWKIYTGQGVFLVVFLLTWLFKTNGETDAGSAYLATIAYCFSAYIWIMAFAAFFMRKTVYAYYKTLAERRTPANSEIVESYRTLREHGNAFFIIIWEIIFAVALLATFRLRDVKSLDEIFWYGLLMCANWTLPAAMAWSVASRLEGDFVRNS